MRLAFFVPLALVACSNSNNKTPDAQSKDVGFNKPTAAVHSNMQVTTNGSTSYTDLGPANLSCFGMPSSDVATAVPVTYSTIVKDFQSGNAVPSIKVIAFDGSDTNTVFDTQTSDPNGNIAFTIPTGHKRVGFKMTDTTTPPSVMPTFLLNLYFDPNTAAQNDPNKIQSVSNATAATLPALIGETRMPGTGVIAGAFRDCQKNYISNFVATVSSTKGTATPVTGAEAYYFSAGVDLPVHHTQQDAASGDGLFMVIQLPTAPSAFVQLWGFKNDADLASGTLSEIAELEVPVIADTVITGSYEPLRQ